MAMYKKVFVTETREMYENHLLLCNVAEKDALWVPANNPQAARGKEFNKNDVLHVGYVPDDARAFVATQAKADKG